MFIYIKYIYIHYNDEYKYIHANTCKYFQNIYCMCVSLYNPKSEKVGTVWKTQIKKESSDF